MYVDFDELKKSLRGMIMTIQLRNVKSCKTIKLYIILYLDSTTIPLAVINIISYLGTLSHAQRMSRSLQDACWVR